MVKLVFFVGVLNKVPEEAQTGALPDEDKVCGAVSEVSRGRQALWRAGARAAHTGHIDGDKLSTDHTPITVAIFIRLFILL